VGEELRSVSGVEVLVCAEDGPALGAGTVTDLVGAAMSQRAEWVAVPVSRLDEPFFDLRSGVAGEVVQKLTTYRLGLAVLGDVTGPVAASTALRDFVREANRGRTVWFLADLDELAARLVGPR
jgi:hypothetical protein